MKIKIVWRCGKLEAQDSFKICGNFLFSTVVPFIFPFVLDFTIEKGKKKN